MLSLIGQGSVLHSLYKLYIIAGIILHYLINKTIIKSSIIRIIAIIDVMYETKASYHRSVVSVSKKIGENNY